MISSSQNGETPELSYTPSPLDLAKAGHAFAAEVAGMAERKKKTIHSPAGLQCFFLYVRAHGSVPTHKVSGAITVQTIFGDARLIADSINYDLSAGTLVCLGAGVPHDVFASTETVLLVTHVLKD